MANNPKFANATVSAEADALSVLLDLSERVERTRRIHAEPLHPELDCVRVQLRLSRRHGHQSVRGGCGYRNGWFGHLSGL